MTEKTTYASQLIGKTIANVDTSSVNVIRFKFEDGTVVSFTAESDFRNIPHITLTEES